MISCQTRQSKLLRAKTRQNTRNVMQNLVVMCVTYAMSRFFFSVQILCSFWRLSNCVNGYSDAFLVTEVHLVPYWKRSLCERRRRFNKFRRSTNGTRASSSADRSSMRLGSVFYIWDSTFYNVKFLILKENWYFGNKLRFWRREQRAHINSIRWWSADRRAVEKTIWCWSYCFNRIL